MQPPMTARSRRFSSPSENKEDANLHTTLSLRLGLKAYMDSDIQYAISQLRIVHSGLHLVTYMYLDMGNVWVKSTVTETPLYDRGI